MADKDTYRAHDMYRQMDARAFSYWAKYGERYAGVTIDGWPVVWRPTTVPVVCNHKGAD